MSLEEENDLVEALEILADWGWGQDRTDLAEIVKNLLDEKGRVVVRFTKNRPGLEWIPAFEKWHKDRLSRRVAEGLPISRVVGVNVKSVSAICFKT